MRILAIETTDLSGSVAALDDARVLHWLELPSQPRSAAMLASAIDELLLAVGWKPAGMQLIAVATGPGSFTGLRVGVTTAKMFAYAVGAEVVGVNTLEAIAWQAPPQVTKIWTIIDAQRQQLFAGQLERVSQGLWKVTTLPAIVDGAEWLATLPPGSVVSGPGLIKFKSQLPAGVLAVDQHLWRPQAATVGRLALQKHQLGQRDDIWSLAPQYFRPSAAEEKRSMNG